MAVVSDEKKFELIVEELRAVNKSALEIFRLGFLALALLVSAASVTGQVEDLEISVTSLDIGVYMGIGFLLGSMIISALVSIFRLDDTNWFSLGSPSIDSDKNKLGKMEKKLINGKRVLILAQFSLITSILLIASGISQIMDLGLLKFMSVFLPILALIVISSNGRFLLSGDES